MTDRMKTVIKTIISAITAVVALSGCISEKERTAEHHFGNKLYLKTSSELDEILVKPDGTTTVTRSLTVGIPLQAETDITGKVVASPALLDTYKLSYYDDDVVALDETMCRISGGEFRISAGSNTSGNITVEFGDISTLDKDKVYVMPVALTDVQGMDVLQSKTVVYYIFKSAALVDVVADLSHTRAWPVWPNPEPLESLDEFTMECLLYFNKLEKTLTTIMGIEGKFLLRVGDVGIATNQLQISSDEKLNTSVLFETNRWYHLAVTYSSGNVTVYVDGKKTDEGAVSRGSQSFSIKHSNESGPMITRCFWVGYSFDDSRYLDGRIAEARIWNRVLTPEEINAPNHFYFVRPDSDGLVTYWKFNDGKGNVIKDHTVYGNHLEMASGEAPEWIAVELPEK